MKWILMQKKFNFDRSLCLFNTPMSRRDLWYGDFRPYGCIPSVSLSGSVPFFFFYMHWHIELSYRFCLWLCFHDFFVPISKELCPFLNAETFSNTQFSSLFSKMLRYIMLTFCTWLSSHGLYITFECRRFLCIFWNIENWKYSFPHFSSASFDIVYMTLISSTSDEVKVSLISLNICQSYATFGILRI